jgi:Rap1a immunity proteins
MKTIVLAAMAALAITAAATAAEEDVHSARSMLPYCKLTSKQTMANTRNALMYGQCFGVISGVVTMSEVMRQARAAGTVGLDPALCVEIPGDTTILQVVDAVVKYGEAHSDMSRERFEIVAFAALRDNWPCGK